MTRPVQPAGKSALVARTLAVAIAIALVPLGLLAGIAPAHAASSATEPRAVTAQGQAYPSVTVWNASVSTDAPGQALITFDYKLTDNTPPGLFMISLYSGPKTSDAGWLGVTPINVTELGDLHYSEALALEPGTYTLRIESKLDGCELENWRDCYGEIKAVDDIVFAVQAEATPTPTPTPTDTPTPEPTLTAIPTPEPTETVTPTPTPSATADTVSTSLSTSTVTPGSQLTVTGRGYAPGEAIDLWLHSTPVKLASFTASPDGTFSRTVTIPEGTVAGAHHIEVRASTSGTTSLSLSVVAGLAVTGADPSLTSALSGVAALLLATGVTVAVVRRRRTHAQGAL